VTGNATFNAGSFLQPTVAAAGQTSLLQAGSLTINGGQVRPTSTTGGLFLMQTDYRIAVGTAGRTGTFTGIDESLLPTFLDGSLIYGATDVTLRLRRNATNFAATSGLTPNENALSVALDSAVTANNPAVYSTYLATYNALLTAGNAGGLGAALDTLSGDALASFPLAEQAGAQRFGDRLAQYTWSNSSNVWLLAAYYDDNADSDGNGPGFDAQAWEFQGGFATSLGENTRLGFSAGMSNGDIDVDERATTGDLDTWSLGVHLRHDLQGFYFAGQGTYSWHSVDTIRGLLLGGSATGEFDAKTWTAGAEVGVSLGGDSLAIEPHATLRHADTSQDSYTESGGTGALVVAARDYQTTRYGLGVRLANRVPDSSIRFSALVRYELESGDETAVLDNTLPSLPTFTVASTELGDDIITAELGLEANVSQGFSLFLGAGAHWRDNENGYQGNAGARIVF
jgi:outer membrane autotransporter protein